MLCATLLSEIKSGDFEGRDKFSCIDKNFDYLTQNCHLSFCFRNLLSEHVNNISCISRNCYRYIWTVLFSEERGCLYSKPCSSNKSFNVGIRIYQGLGIYRWQQIRPLLPWREILKIAKVKYFWFITFIIYFYYYMYFIIIIYTDYSVFFTIITYL